MNCLDKLQQAWQSQPDGAPGLNADALLKVVRLERRMNVGSDVFVVLTFLCILAVMLRAAFRDIHEDWPWLFSAASDVWVAGFVLFDRWSRRRDAGHGGETLLAHVERSVKDLEHQMWLDRHSLGWYVLPIAVGCILPPVVFFAMAYSKKPEWGHVIPLLTTLGGFAIVFIFVHLVMKYAGRFALETRRKELLALRALRETLLNTEE